MKTRIGILGAGSIGCYLGGLLASQGCDIVFIGRETLKKTVQKNGLSLSHYRRGKITLPPESVKIETEIKALSNCDVIFLCTKSHDTQTAATQLSDIIKPTAQLISCQNGLRNVPILQSVLDEKVRLISGAIIPFNVTITQPGHFHCGTGGAIRIEHDIPVDIKDAFDEAGQSLVCGGNFKGDQWAKLLVNLNNALNTLSGTTLHQCFTQKPYRLAFAALVEEGLNIAEALEIKMGTFNGRKPKILIKLLRLPNWLYGLIMRYMVKIDKKARSSMLDDLETGRVSEINYLQGEIVHQAEAIGLKAPYNKTILKAANSAFIKGQSPNLSGKDILALIKE